MTKKLHLWALRWTVARGWQWEKMREVTHDTAQQWLEIFKKDEPEVRFTVNTSKPSAAPYKRMKNPKVAMRLLYLPANSAWAFHFGAGADARPTSMGNHGTFFQSRKDAVEAARKQGLKVSKNGLVSTADFNTGTHAPDIRYTNPGGDKIAATELILFADNERTLYNQKQSIIKNLMRKKAKGQYDPALAAKLWTYWTTNAAKEYSKQFGDPKRWNIEFPTGTRNVAAYEIEARESDKMDAGEYGPLPTVRKKNPKWEKIAKDSPRGRAILRGKNPSGIYVIGIRAIKAGKDTPMLYYDGQNFERRKTPRKFDSYGAAAQHASRLAARFQRQLSKYRIYVVTTG